MIASAGIFNNHGYDSASEYRKRIRDAANSQRSRDFTSRLARTCREGLAMRDLHQRTNYIENMNRILEQRWRSGEFSVLGDFDFAQFMSDVFQAPGRQSEWPEMQRVILAESSQYRSQRIQENLLDVMTQDILADLLTTTLRFGVIERAELAPTVLTGLVNRSLRMSPGTTKLPRWRTPADVVDDCTVELEPTQFYSIPKPNLVTLPPACKKKFAMGYTRELFTADPNGVLRAEIDRHAVGMDLHMEKLLVDTMFGLYDAASPTTNPFPYIENDVQYNTYISSGGPWQNDLTDNPLDGTETPFKTIELLLEKLRDPYSGEPIDLGLNLQLVCTNQSARQNALEGLKLVTLSRDITGAGNPRIEFSRDQGRFGLNDSNIFISRYAYDRCNAWFASAAGGGLAGQDLIDATDGIWLLGDFRRAFAVGTEWDRERITRSGTSTWEYFNQEVLFSVKWLEKTTPAVIDPIATFRNRDAQP